MKIFQKIISQIIFNFTNNGFPMEKERVQNSDDICLAQFTPVSSLHAWLSFYPSDVTSDKNQSKENFSFSDEEP